MVFGRVSGRVYRARSVGQILPAAIFFLLACSAFLYWMVNSGQLVAEKMRLTNAADAAAYSAGVVHARALNFDAYTNRAIIANQIAIAQTISLLSWADYAVDVFCNLGPLGEAVGDTGPLADDMQRWSALAALAVGDAFATYYSGGEACTEARDAMELANDVAAGMVTMYDFVSVALAGSQVAMHPSTATEAVLFARATEVAQRAVDATGANMRAEVIALPGSYGAANFLRRYSGSDRTRLQGVVLDSRDSFTAARNWTVRKLADFQRHRIERRGGTGMPDLDTWRADDSMTERWRVYRLFRGWRDRSQTVGESTVVASRDSTSETSLHSYTRQFQEARYSGLPAVHDLRDLSSPSDPARTSFGVSVRVSKRVGDTLTSQHAAQAGPSGRLAVFDAPGAPTSMAALARAQILFDRPPRADGRTEYASLYNPYWQVRLVAPTAADRAFAATRQGGVALPP
ncbi:MAG: pilus assembly protein TadG-related protein [Pseudomonadota bacterium]